MLIATCRKTLLPMVVRVTPTALQVQPLRPAAKAEGLCAALPKPGARGGGGGGGGGGGAAAYVVWALGEDGALHAHQGGAGVRSEEATLAAVRDELSVLVPREAAKFPVDFFERSTLVTPASDILFSGDALQTTNQGVIKQRLSATSDEYVSATSKASLTLSVNNQTPSSSWSACCACFSAPPTPSTSRRRSRSSAARSRRRKGAAAGTTCR